MERVRRGKFMAGNDPEKILSEGGGRGCWFRRRSAARKQAFRPGETVRIKSGPFSSRTGTVVGINQAKLLLKVLVSILGEAKPLMLNFSEVEKVFGG
jgi:transcription antitermination factor NusG